MERKMRRATKKWKNLIVTAFVSLLIICGMFPMAVQAAGELVELTNLYVYPLFVTNYTNTGELLITGAYKVNDENGAMGANLVIKLTPKDAEYIGAINGITYFDNEKYFDTLPNVITDENMGVGTSTIDSEGNIIVTIPFIGGTVDTQGNFSVTFPFDHGMFDAKIPIGTQLADVEVSIIKGESISTFQQTIISSTPILAIVPLVQSPIDEVVADVSEGLNLLANGFNTDAQRFEPGSYVDIAYTFPEGSVVTGTGGTWDETTNTVTFTLGPADIDGNISIPYSTYWKNTTGYQIMFPSSEFEEDEMFIINSSATFTPWGNSEETIHGDTLGFVRYQENQPDINLTGNVFKDLNNNNVYDVGIDTPYQGLSVEIYAWDSVDNKPTGEAIKTVTTGTDGSYLFEELYSGSYVTRVVKPTGEAYHFATQGIKTNVNDSHVDNNGYGYPITVNSGGTTALDGNAGIQSIGSVTVQYKAGSTQIGSDIKTNIPFTSDTMSGSVVAGSNSYPIPAGYHLVTTETASKDYSLGWGGTTDQVIIYEIEKDTYTVNYSYTVEHYLQQDDGGYVLEDSEVLEGMTNSIVEATANSYEGYRYDKDITGTITSGAVKGDGSLVLRLYYTKDKELVTITTPNYNNKNNSSNSNVNTSDSTDPIPYIGTMIITLLSILILLKKKYNKQ